MSGYQVDPEELAALAGRLGDAADEVRGAAAALDGEVGDLGPDCVNEALAELMGAWARALRGTRLDDLADDVRAAAETYRRADELGCG